MITHLESASIDVGDGSSDVMEPLPPQEPGPAVFSSQRAGQRQRMGLAELAVRNFLHVPSASAPPRKVKRVPLVGGSVSVRRLGLGPFPLSTECLKAPLCAWPWQSAHMGPRWRDVTGRVAAMVLVAGALLATASCGTTTHAPFSAQSPVGSVTSVAAGQAPSTSCSGLTVLGLGSRWPAIAGCSGRVVYATRGRPRIAAVGLVPGWAGRQRRHRSL